MKIMSKKVLTAVLCAATLSSTFLFTGCNLSNVAKGVQQGVQKGQQQDSQVFNQYLKAIGAFNGNLATFNFSYGPTLEHLRNGEHLTSFGTPNFKQLQEQLTKAKEAGVPYDDMKEPLDKVLASLNDIIPVSDQLNTYFSTNAYTTDNYAKEAELGPKYVQLYDQFDAAYSQLNDIVHKHNTENQEAELKAMKDAGKKNAAAVQEAHLRLTAVLDGFESGKPIDANAINQELQAIVDLSTSVSSPEYNSGKDQLNTTVGAIRDFLNDQTDDHYNHMIDRYNSYTGTLNRLDMDKLDK